MGKHIDHSGKKIWSWTLIERVQNRPCKYKCECECGEIKDVFLANINKGFSKNCQKCQDMKKSKDLIGKKFNFITVINLQKVNNVVKARIKCECGNERLLKSSLVKNGTYKSCGLCHLNNNRNYQDLKPNSKFGMLKIIKKISSDSYESICECGNIKIVKRHHLTTSNPSCGCYNRNLNIKNAEKLIGIYIGRLKIIKFLGMHGKDKKTRAKYRLKCKCGNVLEKSICHLNGSLSCGCLQKDSVLKAEKNPNAKLSNIEVKAIRDLYGSGLYLQKDIAKMLNVKHTIICSVLNKKSYSSVK